MSRLVGQELNEDGFGRLNGREIGSRTGKAIVIVTVDDRGWPHPAMLSYREVVAKDRATIDLAVARNSTTARNLKRDGRITLLVTDAGVNYYIKASARELVETVEGVPFMSLYRARVEAVLEDQEPGAEITSGVTFRRAAERAVDPVSERLFAALMGAA
jgi:hypothetical protein